MHGLGLEDPGIGLEDCGLGLGLGLKGRVQDAHF